MISDTDLQLLSALMDDSLDATQRLAAQARFERDATLREQLQAMRRLRAAIRADAVRHRAPQLLSARIRAAADAHLRRTSPRRRLGWLRRVDWQGLIGWQPVGLTLSVAALVLSALNFAVWQPAAGERLMQAAVTSHRRATAGQRLLDVSSSDPRAVQPWLSERLAFSLPVWAPATGDATLVGARLDSLDGRSVAALVYRVREHIVHAFIWPADDDSATIKSASLRGLNVSHWSRGGLHFCIVSDLPRGQLVAFAETLAQADDAR